MRGCRLRWPTPTQTHTQAKPEPKHQHTWPSNDIQSPTATPRVGNVRLPLILPALIARAGQRNPQRLMYHIPKRVEVRQQHTEGKSQRPEHNQLLVHLLWLPQQPCVCLKEAPHLIPKRSLHLIPIKRPFGAPPLCRCASPRFLCCFLPLSSDSSSSASTCVQFV